MTQSFYLSRHSTNPLFVCLCLAMWNGCEILCSALKICPDISLQTAAGVDLSSGLNCSQYLIEKGVPELFAYEDGIIFPDSSQINFSLVLLPLCSEIRVDLTNRYRKQSCMCAPGYTDALYGNTLGLLRDLSNIDIPQISCRQTCPSVFQHVVKLDNINACACRNLKGCMFVGRRLLHNNDVQKSVLILPDNLQKESTLIQCQQQLCAHNVSPNDVLICALLGIEFMFCNECPSVCQGQNHACVIDPISRQCQVQCTPDYFLHTHSNEQCIPKTVCPPHHFGTEEFSSTGVWLNNTCVPCPLGQDNLNSYGKVSTVSHSTLFWNFHTTFTRLTSSDQLIKSFFK